MTDTTHPLGGHQAVALDDPPDTVPVDRDVHTVPVITHTGRREVIPEWLSERTARTAALIWARQSVTHWTLFHLFRLPLYAARVTGRAPVGAGRITLTVCNWARDLKGADALAALVSSVSNDSRGPDALVRIRTHHAKTIQFRLGVLFVAAMAVLVAGLPAWDRLSAPGQVAAVALSVVLLGVAGRRADRPLTDRSATTADVPRLTSDLITRALAAAVPKVARDVDEVKYVAPIVQDGKGWRATIQLPPGVTASDVIKERESLASGLQRPESCVWPEADGSERANAGRLILFVSDKPLASANKIEWPLAKKGRSNVFDPIPIGVDQRGRVVSVVLMYASGLVGAIPRMGKTFLLRLLTLGAGGDPRVELHLYNLKGGADFEPLRHIAYTYRAGDDIDDIEAAVHDLRQVAKDMRRRYLKLKELGPDVCPEAKVTDDLASTPGLHPIFIAVDECQMWFEHPTHGKTLEDLATDLVKRGPAVGIMVWFATQRPDKGSIPTGLRDNAILRFCLKVIGYQANDMVLGTGAYKAGYQATTFGRNDRGIAFMAGETDDPRIVRAAYVDNALAEIIAKRFRADRLAAGRLTGLAAGADPAPDDSSASILDHLLEVWPVGQDKLHCETLARLLADRWPDTYSGWRAEHVTSAVNPHGVRSGQVKRDGQNRRGIALADVRDALADRLDPGDIEAIA